MNNTIIGTVWMSHRGGVSDMEESAQSQAMRLLEELTPGGSEFHNDPQRCYAYIRQQLNIGHQARKDRVRLQKMAVFMGGAYPCNPQWLKENGGAK